MSNFGQYSIILICPTVHDLVLCLVKYTRENLSSDCCCPLIVRILFAFSLQAVAEILKLCVQLLLSLQLVPSCNGLKLKCEEAFMLYTKSILSFSCVHSKNNDKTRKLRALDLRESA